MLEILKTLNVEVVMTSLQKCLENFGVIHKFSSLESPNVW